MLNKVKDDLVFVEAAIMFDTGYYRKMDMTVLIYAPLELRIKRVSRRDKLSAREVRKLAALQMDERRKIEMADIVIRNDGTKQKLFKGLQTMLGIVCKIEM
jgi:dephospho-CoA kinase